MKFYGIFLFIAIAVALFSMSSGMATKKNFNETCDRDDDCYGFYTCRGQKCISPCHGVIKCGPNASCDYDLRHSAVCRCLLTHKGDPYTGCFERTGFDVRNLPGHPQEGY